jgi:hypothetical protein
VNEIEPGFTQSFNDHRSPRNRNRRCARSLRTGSSHDGRQVRTPLPRRERQPSWTESQGPRRIPSRGSPPLISECRRFFKNRRNSRSTSSYSTNAAQFSTLGSSDRPLARKSAVSFCSEGRALCPARRLALKRIGGPRQSPRPTLLFQRLQKGGLGATVTALRNRASWSKASTDTQSGIRGTHLFDEVCLLQVTAVAGSSLRSN